MLTNIKKWLDQVKTALEEIELSAQNEKTIALYWDIWGLIKQYEDEQEQK